MGSPPQTTSETIMLVRPRRRYAIPGCRLRHSTRESSPAVLSDFARSAWARATPPPIARAAMPVWRKVRRGKPGSAGSGNREGGIENFLSVGFGRGGFNVVGRESSRRPWTGSFLDRSEHFAYQVFLEVL